MKTYIPLIQTALWIALIIAIIFIFRKPLYQRIKEGGQIEVGPFKLLEKKVDLVEQRVSDLREKIGQAFLLSMATPMYLNLKKLASGGFGKYTMSAGLKRELYHLRDMGYIDVESINAIPNQGNNLSEQVVVTDIGHMYVQLRDSVIQSESESPSEQASGAPDVRPGISE